MHGGQDIRVKVARAVSRNAGGDADLACAVATSTTGLHRLVYLVGPLQRPSFIGAWFARARVKLGGMPSKHAYPSPSWGLGPPSTMMVAPVMKDEASEARKMHG